MKTSQEIIKTFIDNGYKHMENIPGNQVFYTDNSCSTLVWVEDNVVIEYYLLFPNLETPLHNHPFDNQMIYISGDLTAYRQAGGKPETRFTIKFTDDMKNHLSRIMPIGGEHGFTTGERGSVIYNIQIWPDKVEDSLSATIKYSGTSMGARHEQLIEKFKQPLH
jgi:hypothetical protein